MSCNKSAQRAPNKFRNHYETMSVMFYVNRWGHTQLTRFKPSWYTNDIKRKYPGCFASQEKRTWTLNASFYTFVNWTNCLSVWLVVWLRHLYLVCLFAIGCLLVVATASERAGQELTPRKAQFKSSTNSTQPSAPRWANPFYPFRSGKYVTVCHTNMNKAERKHLTADLTEWQAL